MTTIRATPRMSLKHFLGLSRIQKCKSRGWHVKWKYEQTEWKFFYYFFQLLLLWYFILMVDTCTFDHLGKINFLFLINNFIWGFWSNGKYFHKVLPSILIYGAPWLQSILKLFCSSWLKGDGKWWCFVQYCGTNLKGRLSTLRSLYLHCFGGNNEIT